MQLDMKWKFREEIKKVFSVSVVYNRHHLPFPALQWLWHWGKVNEAALGEVFCGCAGQKGLTLPVFTAMDSPLSSETTERWQLLILI